MITVYVDGVAAQIAKKEILTSGRVGMKIGIVLDTLTWEDLDCLVNFRAGNVVRSAEFEQIETSDNPVYAGKMFGLVKVPHSVMETPYAHLMVGVRGVDESETEVIPTIWADLGPIEPGASTVGEGDTPREKELIEQLIDTADEALAIAQSVRDDADAGEFDGEPGPAGPQGPQGEQGPAGPAGPAGPQGPQGEAGPAGPAGADGQDGADGQNGQDGADGADGYSPTVSITDITGGHRVTITDANGAHSYDVLDGAPGATGPQGPQGETGATGATGPQGPQGETGATGPQGPQGETGATGPQGPAGADGDDYVITQADYQAIADIVLNSLDDADEEAF